MVRAQKKRAVCEDSQTVRFLQPKSQPIMYVADAMQDSTAVGRT